MTVTIHKAIQYIAFIAWKLTCTAESVHRDIWFFIGKIQKTIFPVENELRDGKEADFRTPWDWPFGQYVFPGSD